MLCSSAIWKINFFVTLDQTRRINEGLFYLQSYQGEVPKSQRCALNITNKNTNRYTYHKKGKVLLTLTQPQEDQMDLKKTLFQRELPKEAC